MFESRIIQRSHRGAGGTSDSDHLNLGLKERPSWKGLSFGVGW